MRVRFFTFEQVHNRRGIGSTFIRVHQLINNWPEAELYKYGEIADCLIYQKVYVIEDYTFPEAYDHGVKILDICDPDWFDGALVKRTIDAMDAITCPNKNLQKFIQQMTDKPVVVIPDRFDLSVIPPPKVHKGRAKKAVWFGYSHNAVLLKPNVQYLEEQGFHLTVIANEDPDAGRWLKDKAHYTYKKYQEKTIWQELQKHDIALLPKGQRPQDRFKSNNKTIRANLAGLPVVYDLETLERVIEEKPRAEFARIAYDHAIKKYDVKLSVEQYKDLIKELLEGRANSG